MENSKIPPFSHTNTSSTPVSGGRAKIPFFTKKVKKSQKSSDFSKNSPNSDLNPPTFSPNSTQTPPTPPPTPKNSPNSPQNPNPPQKSPSKLSSRTARLRSRFLSTYYGHPARDMKLICIAGLHGKTTVARFVHDILGSADQQVAIFSSDAPFKASTLHKFLSDAWKAGATHAVITAPVETISAQVFHSLPLHLVAFTDLTPESDPTSGLKTPESSSISSLRASESSLTSNLKSPDPGLKTSGSQTPDPALLAPYLPLLAPAPAHLVFSRDDPASAPLSAHAGTDSTLTYGAAPGSDLHIDSSKLYKLGAEAKLSLDRAHFTVASFLTGQPIIPQMAAAAAIATALHIAPAVIAEGIALYDPDHTSA